MRPTEPSQKRPELLSRSPLMAPKQIEMDDIVQRLYFGLLDRDAEDGGRSLLVVVGDHVRSLQLPIARLLIFSAGHDGRSCLHSVLF